jgi:hypothetical protein
MKDKHKGSHLVEQYLMHQTLQGYVTHKTWALLNNSDNFIPFYYFENNFLKIAAE